MREILTGTTYENITAHFTGHLSTRGVGLFPCFYDGGKITYGTIDWADRTFVGISGGDDAIREGVAPLLKPTRDVDNFARSHELRRWHGKFRGAREIWNNGTVTPNELVACLRTSSPDVGSTEKALLMEVAAKGGACTYEEVVKQWRVALDETPDTSGEHHYDPAADFANVIIGTAIAHCFPDGNYNLMRPFIERSLATDTARRDEEAVAHHHLRLAWTYMAYEKERSKDDAHVWQAIVGHFNSARGWFGVFDAFQRIAEEQARG